MKQISNSHLTRCIALMLIALSLPLLLSCAQGNTPVQVTGFYFNTVVRFTFYGDDAETFAEPCLSLCETYENLFSRTVEGSDIWNLNHADGKAVTVSDETIVLLETALAYYELSNGKTDCTIAPLMDLWDFTSGVTNTPPEKAQVEALLPSVDCRNLNISGNTVQLSDESAAVDLGFIAKGYVADRIKEYLCENGVTSAIIDLGGNVLTIGVKPSGDPFTVGIQAPFKDSGTPIASLSVTDRSVVTSGIYERYFVANDTVYHHILLPQTGFPVQNELAGVTIISDSSLTGDALSTTCLLLGLEEAQKLIANRDDAEAVFVTRDNEVLCTDESLDIKLY